MIQNPGNAFALIMLLAWVPLTFYFFARFRAPVATALSVVGGAMFLPEGVGINLPVYPDLTKLSVPPTACMLAALVTARQRLGEAKVFRGFDLWFVVIAIGHYGTFYTNQDAIMGRPVLAGLTAYDALTDTVADLVMVLGSFVLGRAMFRYSRDLIELFRVSLGIALIYSVFCIIELRLSPQLHNWVYGFMQHDFRQVMRGDAYRPMVFANHGLMLARFMMLALLSGVALWRLNLIKGKTVWAMLFTIVVFFLCRSMGATVMFLLAAPMIAFSSVERHRRVAVVLATIVAVYPILRGMDYVPVDAMLEWVGGFSQERADSLSVRFEHESELLEIGRRRPWFGWGGYGRNRVYDEEGKDLSITDGEWVIIIGSQGAIGYIGRYALYVLPIFMAARALRQLRTLENKILLGTLMMIAALLALDTVPNAALTLPHFFWSGALAGSSHGLLREESMRRQRARARRARLDEQEAGAASAAQ